MSTSPSVAPEDAPDPDTSTCPSCLGVPVRSYDVPASVCVATRITCAAMPGGEEPSPEPPTTTSVTFICDVCDRTGRVPRELAREMWRARPIGCA